MAEGEETPNRVLVYLRVRPPNREEVDWFGSNKFQPILRDESQTPTADKQIIIAKSNKAYEFDRVFRDDYATQSNIFKKAALPTLEHVFSGCCGAVMAYGQTGTGKTHTMQGLPDGKDGEGIIPRSARYIFSRIHSESGKTKFSITMSFVQIYLDKLQDLFKPDAPEVNINHDGERVEIPGITEKSCNTEEEFMKLFHQGEKNRVVRATKMNPVSSRGHAALIINISMAEKDGHGSKSGKLVLVDLAGYERFESTGITTGIAAQEARKINASLLALGSVVNALADAAKAPKGTVHVPYRNAKLTRLLKDCLGGSSVSAIILTMGPCDRYQQETTGTLYFGWRAMAVKVQATVKASFDPAAYADSLKNKLQESIERIRSMASWWGKSHPNDYRHYCAKFGQPDIGDLDLEEIEITAPPITAASHRQTSDLLPDEEDDPQAPEEVREVRREWKREQEEAIGQFEREEQRMRIQHMKELEEAKKTGADEHTLDEMKKAQQAERQMLVEDRRTIAEQMRETQQAEEVQAMLESAKRQHSQSGVGNRVTQMVEFLQGTCTTKDELMLQLFEHIINIESDNAAVMEQQSLMGSSGQDVRKLQNKIADLETDLLLMKEKADYFEEEVKQKKDGSGRSSTHTGSPPSGNLRPGGTAPASGTSPANGRSGYPPGPPGGGAHTQPAVRSAASSRPPAPVSGAHHGAQGAYPQGHSPGPAAGAPHSPGQFGAAPAGAQPNYHPGAHAAGPGGYLGSQGPPPGAAPGYGQPGYPPGHRGDRLKDIFSTSSKKEKKEKKEKKAKI